MQNMYKGSQDVFISSQETVHYEHQQDAPIQNDDESIEVQVDIKSKEDPIQPKKFPGKPPSFSTSLLSGLNPL